MYIETIALLCMTVILYMHVFDMNRSSHWWEYVVLCTLNGKF